VIGRGDQGWGGLALRSEPASDVGDERDYGGHRYVGDHEEHGTERRVLRGGSFSSLRRSVRAASRYHGAPDPRYGYGCRVVLSPFAFDL